MELIADGLLIATAMTAGIYCLVLSKRLRRLTDSGSAIGPQIEALDQALGNTRAALAEIREGVSELRGSTKAAVVQLARETARGEEMAEQIQRGVEEAKATMQRLYEAGARIEAHENRSANAGYADEDGPDGRPVGNNDAGAGEDAQLIEAQPVASDDAPLGWKDDGGDPARAADSAAGPKVALPEGKLVESDAVRAEPVESPGAASERAGAVLKAERVVL